MKSSWIVWAPRARSVELELEGDTAARLVLERGDRGYFHLQGAQLPAGARYRLRIDGGPAVPDPRSEYQPLGVHGPSQRLEHESFAWTDAAVTPTPWSEAILVVTGSALGTIAGARLTRRIPARLLRQVLIVILVLLLLRTLADLVLS